MDASVDLEQRIRQTDNYYKSLIDSIPPEFYGFYDDVKEKLKVRKHALVDSMLTVSQKKLSKQAKQRMSRLDPDQLATVSQITEFIGEQSTSVQEARPTEAQIKPQTDSSVPSRQELVQRLEQKIEEFRRKRKASSADIVEKKRLKRRLSKAKLKIRTKAAKQSQAGGSSNAKEKSKEAKQQSSAAVKPITNSDGKVVYSKFDFAVSGEPKPTTGDDKDNRRRNKHKMDGKNYKKLLEKVQKREEVLQHLNAKGDNRAQELKQKFQWDAALMRAEGQKVKDNPQLLMKTIKRKEKQKERSRSKLADRVASVKRRQDFAQEKRKQNINERKKMKKDQKINKAKKKGRLIPGF